MIIFCLIYNILYVVSVTVPVNNKPVPNNIIANIYDGQIISTHNVQLL